MPITTPPATTAGLPADFISARTDYNMVYTTYPATLSADNAMYHYALTYFDEHDCTSEQPAMTTFLSAYPSSFYAASAQTHITTDVPGSAGCWF